MNGSELRTAFIEAAKKVGSTENHGIRVYRIVAVKPGCTWDGENIGRLEGIPITSLEELAAFRESELSQLRGMGSTGITIVRAVLQEVGLDLTPELRGEGDFLAHEVTRCRDCIRYENDCEWNEPDLEEPDGFCAWAIRKE